MTPSQPPTAAQATSIDESEQRLAAQEFAAMLGKARREAGAPVRTIFCVDDTVESTPLARLISSAETGGGGRGGQVRVKLYVSLLWVCAKAPHEVSRPARAWAALLGLPDPSAKGARRIHQAFADLEDRGFVSVRSRGGLASEITLLNEDGTGGAYTNPPDSYSALGANKASRSVLERHQYFRIPSRVWTDGLVEKLDGPAFAMLLILLAEQRGKAGEVWFSPSVALSKYGLSPSTQRKGLESLRELHLVTTRRKVVSQDGMYISMLRTRNVHKLSL